MIDVSIIVLNYKSKGLIKEQLRHFFADRPERSCEVIVVDNASNDGIAGLLAQEFPHARFVPSPVNRGYAAGNNLGIRQSSGRYILIANPDIVLSAKLVDGLYDFMEQHPRAGIAGPKLTNADGSLQYSCLRFPDLWLPLYRRTLFANTRRGAQWLSRYFMKDWDHAVPRDVDWLFGACLLVRRDAVEKVGMLDERFFLYLEDTDWCRRFWENGFEVWYVPTVSAIHLHGRTSEGAALAVLTNQTARIHLRSFIQYLRKYRGKLSPHQSRHLS